MQKKYKHNGDLMKTLLPLAMLIVSTFSFAAEITKDQYFDLFLKNKDKYENVEVGMTVEFHTFQFSEGDYNKTEKLCQKHTKEIVVSTDQVSKYLVYDKTTLLSDCLNEKKGEVSEKLKWRELELLEIQTDSNDVELTFKSIELNGTITLAKGEFQYGSDNLTENFIRKIDASKSQFYNIIEESWKTYNYALLRRGVSDPSSLNLENLEIIDLPN